MSQSRLNDLHHRHLSLSYETVDKMCHDRNIDRELGREMYYAFGRRVSMPQRGLRGSYSSYFPSPCTYSDSEFGSDDSSSNQAQTDPKTPPSQGKYSSFDDLRDAGDGDGPRQRQQPTWPSGQDIVSAKMAQEVIKRKITRRKKYKSESDSDDINNSRYKNDIFAHMGKFTLPPIISSSGRNGKSSPSSHTNNKLTKSHNHQAKIQERINGNGDRCDSKGSDSGSGSTHLGLGRPPFRHCVHI